MLRIDIISDTHTKHENMHMPGGDILIHAGDAGIRGTAEEIRRFFQWMKEQNYGYKIFGPGNHDGVIEYDVERARELAAEYGIILLVDSGAYIEGLNFYGMPWVPRFNNWAFMYDKVDDREFIVDKVNNIPDDTNFLITHGPPLGILDLDPFTGGNIGCPFLRDRVLKIKPQYHIFGHTHYQYGLTSHGGTTFINAACTSIIDHRYVINYNDPITIWV